MVLGFYGESNSGKTTLICRVASKLKSKGFSIGIVKHTSRSHIDLEGKDTQQFIESGADVVCAAATGTTTHIINHAQPLGDILEGMRVYGMQVALIEGFKDHPHPKVRVGDIGEREDTVLAWNIGDDISEIIKYIEGRLNHV